MPKRLAQAPRIWREVIAHNSKAPELLGAWTAVRELLGDDIELREHILEDYLALYAIQGLHPSADAAASPPVRLRLQ